MAEPPSSVQSAMSLAPPTLLQCCRRGWALAREACAWPRMSSSHRCCRWAPAGASAAVHSRALSRARLSGHARLALAPQSCSHFLSCTCRRCRAGPAGQRDPAGGLPARCRWRGAAAGRQAAGAGPHLRAPTGQHRHLCAVACWPGGIPQVRGVRRGACIRVSGTEQLHGAPELHVVAKRCRGCFGWGRQAMRAP